MNLKKKNIITVATLLVLAIAMPMIPHAGVIDGLLPTPPSSDTSKQDVIDDLRDHNYYTEIPPASENTDGQEGNEGTTNTNNPENPATSGATFTTLMADGHTINPNSRTLTDDILTLSGTISIQNTNNDSYTFKNNQDDVNAFSALNFIKNGAFRYAVFTDVHIDSTDKNKLHFTVTNFDTTQDGSFGIAASNNANNVDYLFAFHFEKLSAKVQDDNILDTQETANPTYTAHILLDEGVVGKQLQASDLGFEGTFKDASIQKIVADDNNKGFTLQFSKPVNHLLTGESKDGKIIIKNGILSDSQNAYRNPISVQVYDQYVPAITYENQTTSAPCVNGLSTATKIANTVPKVFGDVMKEVTSKAAFKACPLAGLGVDLLMSYLAGGQNDLVMEKLNEMDHKLDLIQGQIAAVNDTVWTASEKNLAKQKIDRYDEDVTFLLHDDSEKMAIGNAQEAINILGNSTSTTADKKQAGDFLQELYSSTKDNTKHLQAFKKFSKDLSGTSDLSVLNGETAISVLNTYLNATKDWDTQTISDREDFLKYMVNAYDTLYGTFLTAIEYDYEINTAAKTALQEQQQALEALNSSKLCDVQKRQVEDEIATIKTQIRALEMPLKNDTDLLNVQGNPLDSVLASNEIIQTTFKNENDAIEKVITEQKGGHIKSNRLKKSFERSLQMGRSLSLYRYYKGAPEQEGEFKKLTNYSSECSDMDEMTSYDYVCSESDFNTLESAATQRGWNLASEMKDAGFDAGEYGKDVWALFTGKTTKDYDSWGDLFNPGHYYGKLEIYNDTCLNSTSKTGREPLEVLKEDVTSLGGKSATFNSRSLFTLNYTH